MHQTSSFCDRHVLIFDLLAPLCFLFAFVSWSLFVFFPLLQTKCASSFTHVLQIRGYFSLPCLCVSHQCIHQLPAHQPNSNGSRRILFSFFYLFCYVGSPLIFRIVSMHNSFNAAHVGRSRPCAGHSSVGAVDIIVWACCCKHENTLVTPCVG